MDNPITCVASIVHEIAADLSHADQQEVISAALVRIAAGTEHALSAVRWSLADWFRGKTETPEPVEDTDLKREMQRARRSVRATSAANLAKWDSLLSRLTERERKVAELLASEFSQYDIDRELKQGRATTDRAVKALRRRLVDPVLWHPILDALYSLPDSKQGRSEYVTDLSEYRTRRAERTSVFVHEEKTEHPRQWKRASADNLAKIRMPQTPAWYPGACRRLPTAVDCSVPRGPRRTEFRRPKTCGAYAVILLPEFRPPQTVAIETDLRPRELADLESGRRWFFEHVKHGMMLSSPVINREFDAAGMFRPQVQ